MNCVGRSTAYGSASRFEIDDEAQADARCAGKFVLQQTGGSAGGLDNVANFGRAEVTSGNDFYRKGNYPESPQHANQNVLIGKILGLYQINDLKYSRSGTLVARDIA